MESENESFPPPHHTREITVIFLGARDEKKTVKNTFVLQKHEHVLHKTKN